MAARPPAPVTAPRVSVGIPTYNRVDELTRAVRSVLDQEHGDVEAVVSDDGSTDGTEQAMRALATGDARVRYVRQAQNAGHAANFNRALEVASGDYFMWLSDDDWLDPSYVGRCLAELRGDRSLVAVCGRALYYRDDRFEKPERPMNLTESRPGARVLHYYAQVTLNGVLYSVMRREDLARHGFPGVLGGDWLLMGAIAARGRIRTLEDTHIHRSMGGVSNPEQGTERLAGGEFGITGLRARHPHLTVAASVYSAIAGGDPSFAAIGGGARRRLVATACAAWVAGRYVPALSALALGRRLRARAGS